MLRILTQVQQCNNVQQSKKLLLHLPECLYLLGFQGKLQQCNNNFTIKELFEKYIYIHIYTYINTK